MVLEKYLLRNYLHLCNNTVNIDLTYLLPKLALKKLTKTMCMYIVI